MNSAHLLSRQPQLVLCELPVDPDQPVESVSPFCLKVRRALAWSGLVFESKIYAQPRDLRTLNPVGQAPVLLVDDQPIADSTRILERIDRIPGAKRRLLGDRPPLDRAESALYEELADTSLNGFVIASRWADDDNWSRVSKAFFGREPAWVRRLLVPRVRRNVCQALHSRDVTRAGMDACWRRFETLLDRLGTRAPRHGFWIDDSPCPADFAIFGQLQSLRTELTPRQRDSVESRRWLAEYLDRVQETTAIRRLNVQSMPAAPVAA